MEIDRFKIQDAIRRQELQLEAKAALEEGSVLQLVINDMTADAIGVLSDATAPQARIDHAVKTLQIVSGLKQQISNIGSNAFVQSSDTLTFRYLK